MLLKSTCLYLIATHLRLVAKASYSNWRPVLFIKMATRKAPAVKGILKHTSSLDRHDPPLSTMPHPSDDERKQMKWDEMNILATNHPPDKDYGHMKIDEPPTPYSKYSDIEDEDMDDQRRGSFGKINIELDPDSLASKLADADNTKFHLKEDISEEESSDEDDEMDEQQREEHATFELKRKLHYNEYQAVQLAKRLMAEEGDDDDDDEAGAGNAVTNQNEDGVQGGETKNSENIETDSALAQDPSPTN